MRNQNITNNRHNQNIHCNQRNPWRSNNSHISNNENSFCNSCNLYIHNYQIHPFNGYFKVFDCWTFPQTFHLNKFQQSKKWNQSHPFWLDVSCWFNSIQHIHAWTKKVVRFLSSWFNQWSEWFNQHMNEQKQHIVNNINQLTNEQKTSKNEQRWNNLFAFNVNIAEMFWRVRIYRFIDDFCRNHSIFTCWAFAKPLQFEQSSHVLNIW